MRAGELRYRITIQQLAAGRDTFGAELPTWATFKTVQAGFNPKGGRELFAGKQVQGEDDTVIGIRYIAGVTPKMRVQFQDGAILRTFDIQALTSTRERRRDLMMLCKERYL